MILISLDFYARYLPLRRRKASGEKRSFFIPQFFFHRIYDLYQSRFFVTRKSVMTYLKNHGLRDPGKLLTQQLLVVRNLTDTNDVFAVCKFASSMIIEWMKNLDKRVASASQNARNNDGLKTLRNFVQRNDSVVSPIDGINYFCQSNTKFSRSNWLKIDLRQVEESTPHLLLSIPTFYSSPTFIYESFNNIM